MEDPLAEYKQWVKEDEDGPPLSDGMAHIVDKLTSTGLEDKELKDRVDKYVKPKTSSSLTRMRVNAEIWSSLSTVARSKDLGLQALQAEMRAGLTAVARLADSLKDNKDLLSTAMDALAILGHVHKGLSMTRREYLRPKLSEECRQVFTLTQPAEGNLFGDNLGQKLKEIAEGNSLSR